MKLLRLIPLLMICSCTTVDASYEVKVNLDPVIAQAQLSALAGDASAKPRSVVYYRISPTPTTDRTIVRARRDNKNKTDLDVKLRDIHDLSASLLTAPQTGLDELECEYDIGLTGDGKLSCDVKTEFTADTTPLDGATTMARLDENQLRLLSLGVGRPAATLSLTACPTVSTLIWKDLSAIDGCTDDVTLEAWTLGGETLYELSCKTTLLEPARDGLQARIDELGVPAASDQRGKTERALELCPLP